MRVIMSRGDGGGHMVIEEVIEAVGDVVGVLRHKK
jgi:hypothetical protein